MAKTTLTITANNNMYLTDSDGVHHDELVAVTSKLNKLRVGTIVKIKNVHYPDVVDDKTKAYYLLFNRYEGAKLIYCNLAKSICTVLADSTIDVNLFRRRFNTLVGRLHVLHGNNERQAYCVKLLGNNQFAINDDGVVTTFGELTEITRPYKNCGGEEKRQKWLDLVDAVEFAVSQQRTAPYGTRAVVCTEKGTVLFIC